MLIYGKNVRWFFFPHYFYFQVTFNLCPIVHHMRAWRYAYSEARKGKWEQLGRDRERFVNRINEVSRILSPVLDVDHRQKVYEQRFCGE